MRVSAAACEIRAKVPTRLTTAAPTTICLQRIVFLLICTRIGHGAQIVQCLQSLNTRLLKRSLGTLLCLYFWFAGPFGVRWIELAKRMPDSMIGTKEGLPFDNGLSAVSAPPQ